MKISVIMPVYNAELFLQQALDSILNQTLRDFEFCIADDCSGDSTWEILCRAAAADSRIRLFRNEQNRGVAGTLNFLLEQVSPDAVYVARMDADDEALPERLERQAAWLDTHPETGIVGCALTIINEAGDITGERRYPVDPAVIRKTLIDYNPLAHPTVMMRKSVVDAIGHYSEHTPGAEDYDYWLRIGKRFGLANLAEPLLRYRISSGQMKQSHLKETLRSTLRLQRRYLLAPEFRSPINVAKHLAKYALLLLPDKVVLMLFQLLTYQGGGGKKSSLDFFRIFLGGMFWTVLGVGVVGVANYLTRRVMARSLPEELYGFFYAAVAFFITLFSVARLGTVEASTFLLAEAGEAGKPERARSIFGWIARYNLILGVGGVVLCLATAPWIMRHVLSAEMFPADYLRWLAPYFLFYSFSLFLNNALNATRSYKVNNLLQAGQAMLLLGMLLVFLPRFGVGAAAVAYCASFAVAAAAAFAYLKRRFGWSLRVDEPHTGRSVFGISLFLALPTMADLFMTQGGLLMLSAIGGLRQAAVYAIAMPVAEICRTLLLLPLVFSPVATAMHSAGNPRALKHNYLLLSGLFCLLTGASVVVSLFWGKPIIALLFGEQFTDAAPAMAMLVPATMLGNMAQLNNATLNAQQSHRTVGTIALILTLLAPILYGVLIGRLQNIGCALATLILCLLWASSTTVAVLIRLRQAGAKEE